LEYGGQFTLSFVGHKNHCFCQKPLFLSKTADKEKIKIKIITKYIQIKLKKKKKFKQNYLGFAAKVSKYALYILDLFEIKSTPVFGSFPRPKKSYFFSLNF
jgi:hypothetical protein